MKYAIMLIIAGVMISCSAQRNGYRITPSKMKCKQVIVASGKDTIRTYVYKCTATISNGETKPIYQ